jgi:hypothetical protein
MLNNKATKERVIESHLRHYNNYKIGILNAQRQLDYISPSLVGGYSIDGSRSLFFVSNNTERVALDRIESKRAIDLREEIEQYKVIVDSIDSAFAELKPKEKDFVRLRYFECLSIFDVKLKMGYSEEKSVYRLRRHVLEKLVISLNNLRSI